MPHTSTDPANRSTVSSSTRQFQASDLSHLHVRVAELRPATDRKGWLYVFHVSCAGRAWHVAKRYSEIREFYDTLCMRIVENHESCSEKCHFLAGCETYKFPKKHLLHTRGVLEERANDFEQFFERVTMRLNLCDERELARCYVHGCSTLDPLLSFLDIPSQFSTARPHPYSLLRTHNSAPLLLKERTSHDGRGSIHGRMSLASLQEVHSA